MSIEQALLARARPYMIAARARAIVAAEASKGCCPDICANPVGLEPPFEPLLTGNSMPASAAPAVQTIDVAPTEADPVRLQAWISPQQEWTWNRCELFLKELSLTAHRVGWEIVGNRERILCQILCHPADLPVVRAAFAGQFERCELSRLEDDSLARLPKDAWADAVFVDFHPPSPYSRLLTSPDELQRPPCAALMSVVARLPPPAIALYQVIFAPVSPDHDWHHNVRALWDLDFATRLIGGLASTHRFAQQAPSGDLRQMAMGLEVKAHNDKPFFAAALRIGLVDGFDRKVRYLQALGAVTGLIQHGGRPLSRLTEADYGRSLPQEAVKRMFTHGLAHRHGFLVNSWELATLVHPPSPEIVTRHDKVVDTLETLPATEALGTGTSIGTCFYAGLKQPVCIPLDLRAIHVHLIGQSGMGKSSVVESMVLQDVAEGVGAAVLDPHGRLVQRLLYLLPEACVDRIIYIDFGDPDWVPIWNPFRCGAAGGPGRIADDIVRAFKSFVTGWGDRLEHLLRHAIFAVLHLPGSSLLDVSNLLRKKSEESRLIRRALIQVLDDEVPRLFWRQDFDQYARADLTPPQHKLSKLLTSGTASLMLSQGETSFDLRDVMDTGKILLVDLSALGPGVREILGCFMLSLLHLTALGRGAAPSETRKPFHIYCDEAHKFLTDALEDLIAETRKFGVSLTLAHQYMSQFGTSKSDALSNVGSTIMFKVDSKEAYYLRKDLQGLVEVDDLITLGVGEAIARIGNHVVRLKTHRPLDIPETHARDLIIARSRARYYKPASEVRRAVRHRVEGWWQPPGPGRPAMARDGCKTPTATDATRSDEDLFAYDEF